MDKTQTNQTNQTTAQRISALLGDDGQAWETEDGRDLETLCREHGCTRPTVEGDRERYVFADGSVITVLGGGWDYGFADCWCWEGEGHTQECRDDSAPGTLSTTIEQHRGDHPGTGLPMVELTEIVTRVADHEDPSEIGAAGWAWWADVLPRLHEAEVELASLPADQREAATLAAQDACAALDDLADHPEAILGAVRAARGVGRPAKSPGGDAATEALRFRCTHAQAARIRELAEEAGQSVTDYLLSRVL